MAKENTFSESEERLRAAYTVVFSACRHSPEATTALHEIMEAAYRNVDLAEELVIALDQAIINVLSQPVRQFRAMTVLPGGKHDAN